MNLWHAIEAYIFEHDGKRVDTDRRQSINGGCISQAYVVGGAGQRYFVKINSQKFREAFQAEYQGLQELYTTDAIRVPQPVAVGTAESQAFIIMEHLTFGQPTPRSYQSFGQQLAHLHQSTQAQFGWHCDNSIGATPQPNLADDSWVHFYQQQRLAHQLHLAQQNACPSSLIDAGQRLIESVPVFFTDYSPQPSLLHGDLWLGNWGFDQLGKPVIFDPAVYFGDREADIAMTELFGRAPDTFYKAYKDVWPLDSGYGVRRELYNLYHILNHFNLFGGTYAIQAERMIQSLLSQI